MPSSFVSFSQPSNFPSLFSPFPESFKADRKLLSALVIVEGSNKTGIRMLVFVCVSVCIDEVVCSLSIISANRIDVVYY